MWILNFSNVKFGIEPKNIILIGDSSGASIIIAVTLLLINKKLRKPDVLILGYPVCSLSINFFVPSLIRSFDDIMFNHKTMQFLMDNYKKKGNADTDEFLSSILIPKEKLK